MMIVNRPDKGFCPVATYARKAKAPLTSALPSDSWDMLGTNLSIKIGEDQWDSDSKRLMLMDRRDFNTLGMGLDDLIEGYIQTVLSIVSIDKLCAKLLSDDKFNHELFASLNNDRALLEELYNG